MSEVGSPSRRAVAIVGPTAAGKSRVAMRLAEQLGLPILCCDSVQVYRRLDVGSAKPSASERARVRHELLDLVEPDQDFTAGEYARLAHQRLDEGPALICGGTGFYLHATLWPALDLAGDLPRSHPRRREFESEWREREAVDAGSTHRALAALDPESAGRIHPNNLVRTLRALWLCQLSEGPRSALRGAQALHRQLELLMIIVDPGVAEVDSAIADRCEGMLAQGWVDEVERLLAEGLDPGYKSLRSLGYRQLADYLRAPPPATAQAGPSSRSPRSLAEVGEAIKAATRHYARRQRTYFRHQFRDLPADRIVTLHDPIDCPTRRVEAFLRGDPS